MYVSHLKWVETISPESMRQGLLDLRIGHIEANFEDLGEADELSRRKVSLGAETSAVLITGKQIEAFPAA